MGGQLRHFVDDLLAVEVADDGQDGQVGQEPRRVEAAAVVAGELFDDRSLAHRRPAHRVCGAVDHFRELPLRPCVGPFLRVVEGGESLGPLAFQGVARETRAGEAVDQQLQAERAVRGENFHGPAGGAEGERSADVLDRRGDLRAGASGGAFVEQTADEVGDAGHVGGLG